MKPPSSKTAFWSLLTAAFGACAVWVALPNGSGPVPLAESSRLRDVVEPITITQAVFMDDGGSLGVEFQDARGTIKKFCRVSTFLDDSGEPNYLEFGVLSRTSRDSLSVGRAPVSGVDERALLGLLERWVQTDPAAIEVQRDFRRLGRGELDEAEYWRAAVGKRWAAAVVLSILNDLRARN